MPRPLKILISAYACEPDVGSEPGVGWHTVAQIARFHEVWVLTRANNRPRIQQALVGRPMPNVHWVFVDLPYWARFWKKGPRGVHLYYCLWQTAAYLAARRLAHRIQFDLAHHVTFATYWLPSFLPLLGIPFIWGPVGGGESAPREFYSTFTLRARVSEHLRDFIRLLAEGVPSVRSAARQARVTLATTPETAARVRRLGRVDCQVVTQVGLSSDEMASLHQLEAPRNDRFRLLSIGRLLDLKGFHLGLMAFAGFQEQHPNSEYWIIGDGPQRKRLEDLARRLNLAEKVHFTGWLPRQLVLEHLAACHVLVHPSLHDSGGFVCVEAMAAGRPVICLDLGGPSLLVGQDAGFTIPAKTPSQAIEDLKEAMSRLAAVPDLRSRMGRAGRERVQRKLTWERKGEWLAGLYEDVVRNDCREH